MLLILLPISYRYAPDHLKELDKLETCVLMLICNDICDRHLAGAETELGLVLGKKICLGTKQI